MFRLPKKLPRRESGQALLIVVLSLAVVLTVVLSILARSVTDIRISTGGEEALRAFSAAEAGIETSLNSLTIGESSGDLGGATFTASVTEIGEGSTTFASPSTIFSGETSTFWFVAHDAGGNLVCDLANNCFTGSQVQVCWGKEGTPASDNDTPALEVGIVYADTPGDYSSLQIARGAFDPNSTRRSSNNFSAPDAASCAVGSENFAFSATLDLDALNVPGSSYSNPDGLQFLVARMLYNTLESHPTGISVDFPGNTLLPAQGALVESVGTSGDANRKISVFQGFGEPPLPLGAVIFSPVGVTK